MTIWMIFVAMSFNTQQRIYLLNTTNAQDAMVVIHPRYIFIIV